jgi:hypothetical protein
MINFVRVFGRPKSKGVKRDTNEVEENKVLFLNPACIKAIYPFWGVLKNRIYFDCTPTFEGAELPFCWVEDFEGNKYVLLPSEWKAILTEEQIKQMTGKLEQGPSFGFASNPSAGKDKEPKDGQ